MDLIVKESNDDLDRRYDIDLTLKLPTFTKP